MNWQAIITSWILHLGSLSGQLTSSFPVSLKLGSSYRMGLNSLSPNNFQSASGVPLTPQVYEFKTR